MYMCNNKILFMDCRNLKNGNGEKKKLKKELLPWKRVKVYGS